MTAAKPAEWAVRCPRCGARPGLRCTSPRGRKLAIPSHEARITAWTTQTTERQQQTGDDQ